MNKKRYAPLLETKRRTELGFRGQSEERGSNSRPSAWEADALPTELPPHRKRSFRVPSDPFRMTIESTNVEIFLK